MSEASFEDKKWFEGKEPLRVIGILGCELDKLYEQSEKVHDMLDDVHYVYQNVKFLDEQSRKKFLEKWQKIGKQIHIKNQSS